MRALGRRPTRLSPALLGAVTLTTLALLGTTGALTGQNGPDTIRLVFAVDDTISFLGGLQIDAASVPTNSIGAALVEQARVAFPFHAWRLPEPSVSAPGLRVTLMNGEGAAASRWWLRYDVRPAATDWTHVPLPDRCTTVWEGGNVPPGESTPEFAQRIGDAFVRALRGDSVPTTPGATLDCSEGDQRLRAIEDGLTARVPVRSLVVGTDGRVNLEGIFAGVPFRKASILGFSIADQVQDPLWINMSRVGPDGFVRLGECYLGEAWGRVTGQFGEFAGPPPFRGAPMFEDGARVRAFVLRYQRPFLGQAEDQMNPCFLSGADTTR